MDEYTRECLAIDIGRSLTSESVLERLADLFVYRGVPAYIRSDNGSEFTARAVREWLEKISLPQRIDVDRAKRVARIRPTSCGRFTWHGTRARYPVPARRSRPVSGAGFQ